MSSIVQPYFWNEAVAHGKLGQIVWPSGPECPHCGNTERIGAVIGKGARTGLKLCCRCRKQFRVTMATIFDSSHVPLQKWLQACFLLACCKTRINAHQLHLKLEVTNKTALRMLQQLDPLAARIHRDSHAAEAQRGELLPDAFVADLWAETLGLTLGRGARDGADESRSSLPPTRQFFGFVEIVRLLGWRDDEPAFDAMLAASKRSRRRIETSLDFAARAEFVRGEPLSPAPAG
ncbi:MAG: transposase [Stellaceae bacterium]